MKLLLVLCALLTGCATCVPPEYPEVIGRTREGCLVVKRADAYWRSHVAPYEVRCPEVQQ